MGKMHVDIVINVPKDTILKIMNNVSHEFFEKRPEYRKWYRVYAVEDGIVYEVNAYGAKLEFYIKIRALDNSRSQVAINVSWSDIKNILTLGLVKSQAKLGIDTVLLQLLCVEHGYREGLKTGKTF